MDTEPEFQIYIDMRKKYLVFWPELIGILDDGWTLLKFPSPRVKVVNNTSSDALKRVTIS